MSDLAGFLLARIAEDAAAVAGWPLDIAPPAPGRLWVDTLGRAIYQPRQRVLAECEAKRRVVDEARNLLRLLALPYADHPDYRPEWAVEDVP